eukprot:jgi/Ulvmu1/214/UM001_0218.1
MIAESVSTNQPDQPDANDPLGPGLLCQHPSPWAGSSNNNGGDEDQQHRLKSLRFTAVGEVLRVAASHGALHSSGLGEPSLASALSDIPQPPSRCGRRSLLHLWKAPLEIVRAVAGMHGAAHALAPGTQRRPSLKCSSTCAERRLKKKPRVRFKGLPSAHTVLAMSLLVKYAGPGSLCASYWAFVIACFNAIDSLLLPLALVAREFVHNERQWLARYDRASVKHAVAKHTLWANAELFLDIVFLLDFLFRAAQAAVRDMGFAESSMDSIVDAQTTMHGRPVTDTANSHVISQTIYEKGWTFGKALQQQLRVSIPLRLMLMIPVWLDRYIDLGNTFVMMAMLARTYRIIDLMKYFSVCQEDVATDVRLIAFFKFSYIIFSTGHWLGCLYYGMAALSSFDTSHFRVNWVDAWVQQTNVNFDWLTSSGEYDYVVMLFKGFSVLTNLGYEVAVPQRHAEMILSIVAQNVKVVVDAYILGTLFHYLVKKDPELEAARDLMASLHRYCSERGLSSDLKAKLEAYLLFQQKNSSAISKSVLHSLPRSLQARVAQVQCDSTIQRNMHLFNKCNQQFLQRFMMTLNEVSLMPEELIIKHGDMARALCFAVKGTLVVRDSKGSLVELLSGEGTAPCVTGTVSFFLGVPEPHDVRARQSEDSAVLVATKASFDQVISHYPEHSDVILTNMLMQFGLDRDGSNLGTSFADQQADDEGYAHLRGAIQQELKRCQESALTELTYAASSGHDDVVKNLLARGLPIDAGDYDGRTTLHLAVAEGKLSVVSILLSHGASVNVVDRWGSTPLFEALTLNKRQIAEALVDRGAVMQPCAFSLVKELAEKNGALLQLACSRAGADVDSCDYDQRSVLHTLCAAANLHAVESMLELGANVNCVDRWGGTPIQDAIQSGDKMIVQLLKHHGASLSASFQHEALFNAARTGNVAHLELLSAAGADFGTCNYDKMTALHIAAGTGQTVALYVLITEHAADVNRNDVWGSTPLDHAVRGMQLSCIVLLMSNEGECHTSEQQKRLQGLIASKSMPMLKTVRKSICRAVTNELTELLVMGSSTSQPYDEALKVRRSALNYNIKTLSTIRERSEEVMMHMQDTHSLLTAMWTMLMLTSAKKTPPRTLVRQSSKNAKRQNSDTAASNVSHIVKLVMRMLMRSHLVEGMLHDLAQATRHILGTFEPHLEHLEECFTLLGLTFEAENVTSSDLGSLLYGAPGFRQLSLIKIVTWTYFRDQVATAGTTTVTLPGQSDTYKLLIARSGGVKSPKSVLSILRSSKLTRGNPDSRHRSSSSSDESVPVDHGSNDQVSKVVVQLKHMYTWMAEVFFALDLQCMGSINIATDGTIIHKALADGGLEQLWHSLVSEADASHEVSPGRFMRVFFKWMGIEDDWAVMAGHQRSRSAMILEDEMDTSGCETDLDDAATMQAEAEQQALLDLEEVGHLDHLIYTHGDTALKVALQLSMWEQWCWRLGARPPRHEIAKRLFAFVDHNNSQSVSISAMDGLVRLLQSELPLSKATFDFVESLRAQCANDPTRLVGLNDFIDFFATIPTSRTMAKLPPNASWRVCHPDSRMLWLWDVLIRMVALYFFWEVPVSIAFQSASRTGLYYWVGNQVLEALLIVDMFVNISRAFYNEQGILIYDLKAIRVRYISSFFFVDLVAAMPFSNLVAFNGNAEAGYVSWLRLPKMLRIYRMLRLYKEMGRSVAPTSVSMGILRLMPLILGLTHIYGCIWWYIGTVGRELSASEQTGDSWIYYYSGLGHANLWDNSVSITRQYMFSCYWASSTLSTASLVGHATPKNAAEIVFTIWSMLTTLTVYAYIVGEISNMVMASDQALVSMREQMSRVQTFLQRHQFPRDLAVDIVSSFEDGLRRSAFSAEHISGLMSTNLRIEVAMQMTLPLLKGNRLFNSCSAGFTASLSALLREMSFASDEYLFNTNDVCNDLYLVASSSVSILTKRDGDETVSETRTKGDSVGELAFFFRMRHMHSACAGRTRSTVFALAYTDYKQIAASYVDDDNTVLEALLDSVDSGKSEKSQISGSSVNTIDSNTLQSEGAIRRKVDKAVRRRAEQNVVKLLNAVATQDVSLMQRMLSSEQVEVNESDYDDRTALHIAASCGHKVIVRALVERYSASHTVRDRYGGTPLDDAIRERHSEVAKYLAALQRCDHEPLPASKYCQRMIQAAADDDPLCVETLLISGMDPNCADYDNRTPLHLAAANSSMRVLQLLLQQPRTELGPVDNMGHTPLWHAICLGQHKAAALLRSQGAPVQADIAVDLCKAAERNDTRLFELLLVHRIDMQSRDPQGRTALHVAATCGSIEVVSIICKLPSADINPVDGYGSTPLDNARMVGDLATAALLEESGGLPGSHESLHARVHDTKAWVQQEHKAQQQKRWREVLSALPEEQQAVAAMSVAQAQKQFVQAGFINMQILTSALHESISQSPLAHLSGGRSGASLEARMGEALRALTAQVRLLQEVLEDKVRAYTSLQAFPSRVFAPARLAQLRVAIREDINKVLPMMVRLGRQLRCEGLGIPPDNLEPLKRMLSIGVLVYLKVSLPDCLTEDGLDMSQVQTWSVELPHSAYHKRKQEMQFLPRTTETLLTRAATEEGKGACEPMVVE